VALKRRRRSPADDDNDDNDDGDSSSRTGIHPSGANPPPPFLKHGEHN